MSLYCDVMTYFYDVITSFYDIIMSCFDFITLRPVHFQFDPFKILLLLRNFFVIKYFPLTAMLNYLTYWVSYIEKNAALEI